jgi:sugar phosphate isomerase/epimerase
MTDRRTFLKTIAGAAAAQCVFSQTAATWKKQPGLELYTVRDLLAKDFEGTIAKVAEIGYKEVEPVGYDGLEPKQFRALLDRYRLTAPSTHAGATDGPNLERELEGHRIMGFRYTEIRAPRSSAPRAAKTEESVKRIAEQYNRYGSLAKKYGMKILVHNHATEFDRLEGSPKTEYDVLLAETDPALVAMQLDIGWARVAGQDVLAMFRKHPGRFELWHVKDVTGLSDLPPDTPPGKRRGRFVPVGQGEVDYKPLFANAKQAGLKHYVIEQDNAAENGGDSLAAARASYEGLMKVLS